MEFKNLDFADFWTTIKEYVDYVFKVVNNKIKDIKIFNNSDNIDTGIMVSDLNKSDTGNIVYGAGGASSMVYNTKYVGLVPEFKYSQEKDNATAILTSDGWINSESGIKLNNPIVDTGITLYTKSGTSINLNKSSYHYYATNGTILNISSLCYFKLSDKDFYSGLNASSNLLIIQIVSKGWYFDGEDNYTIKLDDGVYIEFIFYNNSNSDIKLVVNINHLSANISLPNESMGKLCISTYSSISYKFLSVSA